MIETNLNELLVRKQNQLQVMYEELDSICGGSLNISNWCEIMSDFEGFEEVKWNLTRKNKILSLLMVT